MWREHMLTYHPPTTHEYIFFVFISVHLNVVCVRVLCTNPAANKWKSRCKMTSMENDDKQNVYRKLLVDLVVDVTEKGKFKEKLKIRKK